jgi:hypothetical protein
MRNFAPRYSEVRAADPIPDPDYRRLDAPSPTLIALLSTLDLRLHLLSAPSTSAMSRSTHRRRSRHIHREPVLPSFSLVMMRDYPALSPVLFPVLRGDADVQSWVTDSSVSFAQEDSDEDVFVVGRRMARLFERAADTRLSSTRLTMNGMTFLLDELRAFG